MKRKDFLKIGIGTLGAATIAAGCVPEDNQSFTTSDGPNIITNRKYKWKMVTTWPPKFPVLGEKAELFARLIEKMSGGRIEIKVYGAGEFVPALEVFDAVSRGSAEIGCGCSYYWVGKSKAAQYFASIPFGMNAQQSEAWITRGGGMELWKEVYEPFNLVPFIAGNTGVQMGGWFNREINSIKDFNGLKMRMPGIAGKVIEKAGGAAVLIAAGEIYTSLERGVIDATEWIGPYHDYKMGFHKIAKYYYYPGWHEPGTNLEFMLNKKLYDSLPEDLQAIIEAAANQAHNWVLSEFESKNGDYLKKILDESDVQLKAFSTETLSQLRNYTREVIDAEISRDAQARKVYESYSKFAKMAGAWSELTEKAYFSGVAGY